MPTKRVLYAVIDQVSSSCVCSVATETVFSSSFVNSSISGWTTIDR